MSDGVRSIQAHWMGGAGAAPPAVVGGARSMQAFWMGGGAVAVAPPAVTAGVRSMQAFWLGGGALVTESPPPPPPGPDLPGGVENTARWPPNVRVRWGFEKDAERKPTPAPPPERGEPVPLRVVPHAPAAEAHVFAVQLHPAASSARVAVAHGSPAVSRVVSRLAQRVTIEVGVAIARPEVFRPELGFVVDEHVAARQTQRRRNQQAAATLAAKYLLDDDE